MYVGCGIQNRNEPSSVAPTPSAETQSILMSLPGQPDRFIWIAESRLVDAKSDKHLCRGALESNVRLSCACTSTHTHAAEHETGAHIKESIWSAVALELSTNFLLQRKADERASHLFHTVQSDSASQIHNSPHTAFWEVAIETLLGSSGQKMRGDERGYFPLHLPLCLPATLFCPQSDCILLYSLPPLHKHAQGEARHTSEGVTIRVNCSYFCTCYKKNCPQSHRLLWRSQAQTWNTVLLLSPGYLKHFEVVDAQSCIITL